MNTNFKEIVKQFNPSWIPSNLLMPAQEGLYEIFTTDGQFVKVIFNSRKEIFLSEDGGDAYDSLAWRVWKDGK